MDKLVTFINLLLIALALVLLVLYRKRREDIASQGYAKSFRLIFIGIALISGICTIDLLCLNILPLFTDSAFAIATSQFMREKGIWISLLFAAPFLFSGLAILINQLIPNTTLQVHQLQKTSAVLTASNNRLNETLITQNKELETSNAKLRRVLRDQQISRMALLQSEKKFRTLFDESPAIFASVNSNQSLTDINLHGARSLGYDTMTLVGKPFTKLVANQDILCIENFIADFFNELPASEECEVRLRRKNQSEMWVKVAGSLIKEKGSAPYLLLVCQDISTLKALEQTLSLQARHDSLTGLLNRYALEEHLEKTLEKRINHTLEPLAFIYIDVDQLKVVNDTCGHIAGDELLKQLAKIFESHIKCDCFARVGGDEFVVVKDHATKESAIELAEIIRNAAEDFTFVWGNQRFRQSVSVGVTLSSPTANNITLIFGAADSACYSAKEAGRNQVVFLEEDPLEKTTDNRREMLWVSRLQEALVKDRFELYFQPIMRLGESHIRYIHYEVLIRYVDDNGDHISPNVFLPAAERFGLSDQVDLWVLTTTLDYLSRHPEHTRALSCCSINLTSHSLASHRTRSAVRQLIASIDFPTSKICFEITETSAIRNLTEVVEFINELKIVGCRFALDDFGTGFSSFGYLKNLDIDYIKIDGSFIRDLVADGIDRAIVTAINAIGHEMGIHIVAEYVENEQIEKELIALKVPYGQGFGLAKPMPMEAIESFYANSRYGIQANIPKVHF